MKTYCFRVWHRDVDSDDLLYIGANSEREAIRNFRKAYPRFTNFECLGEE